MYLNFIESSLTELFSGLYCTVSAHYVCEFPSKKLFQENIVSSSTRNIKKNIYNLRLCLHTGGYHETLNLLHEGSCKMLQFVTSYMKKIKGKILKKCKY